MGALEDVAVEKALSDRYVSRMEPSRGPDRPTGSSSRRRRAREAAATPRARTASPRLARGRLMGKRLWDLDKSRIEIGTILLAHRHKVRVSAIVVRCDNTRPAW